MGGRRVKCLWMSDAVFLGMFRGGHHDGYTVARDAIPDGARIVDVTSLGLFGDDGCRELLITIESDEFDPVPDGQPVPAITPILRRDERPGLALPLAAETN